MSSNSSSKEAMNTIPVMGKSTSLLVEQRIQLRKELEENQTKQHLHKEPQNSLFSLSYLPKDCISNIILHLPLESLDSARFVCKLWYKIINSPVFIKSHMQLSDVGLIFSYPVRKSRLLSTSGSSARMTNFSVESKFPPMPIDQWPARKNQRSIFYIKFLEIKDGKCNIIDYHTTCMGKIRAACEGLIVLDNYMKTRGFIILNPITREIKTIPLGTLCSPYQESYGLASFHETGGYKLVHLFKDELNYVSCEIMDIGSGSWKAVDGPPFGFFGSFCYRPVFAIQALHWLPHVDHNEYIVSMPLRNEKFVKIKLPVGGIVDQILEMCGFLGFVSRLDANQIDVWILRSLGGEVWEKQYSINVGGMMSMIPLYFGRGRSEIVFKCNDNYLYAYDHRLQLMRKVEMRKEEFPSAHFCFPHVNSRVSWRN